MNTSFIADKQTLEDLNLLGRFRPHSIYSLFSKVRTAGGQRLLDSLFMQPMTDPAAINQRSATFRYFQELALLFPFQRETFLVVENYLGAGTAGNSIAAAAGMLRKKMMGSFLRDEQYNQLQAGLTATIEALNAVKALLSQLGGYRSPVVQTMQQVLADERLSWLAAERGVLQLPALKAAKYDLLLRHTLRDEMEQVLEGIYHLDVYIAVSDVARARGWSYAHALPKGDNVFRTSALRHPALEKAVANPLAFDAGQNLLFLTGANMAGKSTFMKSYGIAIYMAHMGFPVAAEDMMFSVRDGLYTSINVPDNLNMGYSHFYAEVLRVKKVAEEVSSGKKLVVIFDELFKGTNVKDAYDATFAVTKAFAAYRNCFFIISTHIIEVGEALKPHGSHVQFGYMPTVMGGPAPRYTYRLTEGITNDRQGMMIIENEGIIESLV